jgi:hypothetical protein
MLYRSPALQTVRSEDRLLCRQFSLETVCSTCCLLCRQFALQAVSSADSPLQTFWSTIQTVCSTCGDLQTAGLQTVCSTDRRCAKHRLPAIVCSTDSLFLTSGLLYLSTKGALQCSAGRLLCLFYIQMAYSTDSPLYRQYALQTIFSTDICSTDGLLYRRTALQEVCSPDSLFCRRSVQQTVCIIKNLLYRWSALQMVCSTRNRSYSFFFYFLF